MAWMSLQANITPLRFVPHLQRSLGAQRLRNMQVDMIKDLVLYLLRCAIHRVRTLCLLMVYVRQGCYSAEGGIVVGRSCAVISNVMLTSS